MKIPIFKKKKNFFKDWNFFSKWGKKSTKFNWEWGQISAREHTKNGKMDNMVILDSKKNMSWTVNNSIHLFIYCFPGLVR